MTSNQAILATQQWIESFIIEYNICPFAKREFVQHKIRYQYLEECSVENHLMTIMREAVFLDSHPETETTLIILANYADFEDYLELVELAEQLFVDQGYEGTYQIASFHPDYCFAQTDFEDASNFTNRSPLPMLHLIREKSIEKVLEHYSNPDSIFERNIELTRSLGAEHLKKLLSKCSVPTNAV